VKGIGGITMEGISFLGTIELEEKK